MSENTVRLYIYIYIYIYYIILNVIFFEIIIQMYSVNLIT